MRKILLFILLALSLICFSQSDAGVLIGNWYTAAAPASYDMMWNGDHGSGTKYLAVDSGSDFELTDFNSTIGAGYSDDGNGMLTTGANQGLYIAENATITANFDAVKGTFWIRVNLRTDGSNDEAVSLCAIADHTDPAQNKAYVSLHTDQAVIGIFEGNNVIAKVTTSATVSTETWTWIGYSYEDDGSDRHSVTVGSTWAANTVEETEALTAFVGNADEIEIGEHVVGSSSTETTWIDDFYYIKGEYQAACPGA